MVKKEEKKEEVAEIKVETTPKVEEKVEDEQNIIVNDPFDVRPTELPLVITLPEDASEAQKEFAKTLNAYAYKNPKKWAEKKDDRVVKGVLVKGLITQLKELKNAPAPQTDNLKFGYKPLGN